MSGRDEIRERHEAYDQLDDWLIHSDRGELLGMLDEAETQLEAEKKYDIEKQRDIWAENCKKAWIARDIAWGQIKELEAQLDAADGDIEKLTKVILKQLAEANKQYNEPFISAVKCGEKLRKAEAQLAEIAEQLILMPQSGNGYDYWVGRLQSILDKS